MQTCQDIPRMANDRLGINVDVPWGHHRSDVSTVAFRNSFTCLLVTKTTIMQMKLLRNVLAVGMGALLLGSCAKPKDAMEVKIDRLLSQMTLEEKIGQMNQLSGTGLSDDMKGQVRAGMVGSILNEVDVDVVNELQRIAMEESRLGIPLVFARDVIHGFKTVMPIPLGQAATWNPAVVEAGARVAAEEASAAGVRWTFSPMIDVSRDPRWGRIAESYGEDTYLSTVMGVATVRGYQTDDLADPTAVAACAKHFCGYGAAEGGRDYNTTWIPETQLRDVYFPPFQAAAEAGCATFMCSFNDINGVPSSGSKFLNNDVLRNEWDYDGLLVSDWASIQQMVPHGFCADLKDAACKAANAAVDMDMAGYAYTSHLKELVKEGQVDEAVVDEAVRNILRLKFRLGLFDNPYAPKQDHPYYKEESLQTAKQAAEESAVLLKNEGNALPLDGGSTLLVTGPLADSPRDQMGTWCFDNAEGERAVTPLQALRQVNGLRVMYEPGLAYSRDRSQAGIRRAVQAARRADAVVCFVGEEAILSGEGKCRADLSLPGAQTELIRALAPVGAPQFSVGASSYYLDAGGWPLFPFGYGLSYTMFEYGEPHLSTDLLTEGGTLTVTCDITNTGTYDAYETAQLYTRDLVASLCQPVRQLRGFEKVLIPAGETRTVTFELTPDDLAFCHADLSTYAEPGEFQVWVSTDSQSGTPVTFEYE